MRKTEVRSIMPAFIKLGPSFLVWVTLVLVLASPASAGKILRGRVVGVHDGDTLTLKMEGNRPVNVRLAQIDAPEIDQRFGEESTFSLTGMALGKYATLAVETVDDYGRIVATVVVDGVDVNREQIRRGMAWAYRQYLHDAYLLQLEAEARQARMGLWSDSHPTPPWRYRHGGGGSSFPFSSPPIGARTGGRAGASSCGDKHYCSEMADCKEARFYFSKCGLTGLDRDHDGVPCESLCGKPR